MITVFQNLKKKGKPILELIKTDKYKQNCFEKNVIKICRACKRSQGVNFVGQNYRQKYEWKIWL